MKGMIKNVELCPLREASTRENHLPLPLKITCDNLELHVSKESTFSHQLICKSSIENLNPPSDFPFHEH